MLILRRKIGDSILIGDNITIVVTRVSGRRVSLGVHAPSDVRVIRGELTQVASDAEPNAAPEPLLEQGLYSGSTQGRKSVGVTGD